CRETKVGDGRVIKETTAGRFTLGAERRDLRRRSREDVYVDSAGKAADSGGREPHARWRERDAVDGVGEGDRGEAVPVPVDQVNGGDEEVKVGRKVTVRGREE